MGVNVEHLYALLSQQIQAGLCVCREDDECNGERSCLAAKAQEMGALVKTKFPGHPVYVHFYSPRWCCRFGNFRNQEAATKLLKKVKKDGFKNACVIKTAITVNK